jgi:hypothetical protein
MYIESYDIFYLVAIGWTKEIRIACESPFITFILKQFEIRLTFHFDNLKTQFFPRDGTNVDTNKKREDYVEFGVYNIYDTEFQQMHVSMKFDYNDYNWFSEQHTKVIILIMWRACNLT